MWEYVEKIEANLDDYELFDPLRKDIDKETHQDVWNLAIHEAGHALAMEVHGPGVATVTLVPSPNFAGGLNRALTAPLEDPYGDLQEPPDHERAVTRLAGPAASGDIAGEEKYLNRVGRALEGKEVWDGDIAQAGDFMELNLRLTWWDALELVREWEAEIRAVAEKLYSMHRKRVENDWYHRSPTLSGGEVRPIVRENAEVVGGTLMRV